MSLQQRHVTRTVEVELRPLYLWEYALKTAGSGAWTGTPAMVLGGGTTWVIDSYDSRNPVLANPPLGYVPTADQNGMYNGAYARDFGNVASNQIRPAGAPYGVLIDAEGANIRGEVQTRGGDNPDTLIHENVEESDRIDQTRITSEFEESLVPKTAPAWASGPASGYTKNPNPDAISAAGSTIANPAHVLLDPNGNQSQGGFTITPPPAGVKQYIEIYVDANLILAGGGITIPPNVYASIYVNGNIDFKNWDINYGVDGNNIRSSGIPGNCLIYGVSTNPAARVDSAGNGHICAAFYGPQYAGHLDGNSEIIGGFVLNTYDTQGGGGSGGDSVGAGFHYDEAMGVVGPIQQYKVVSYFEDFRKDIE
jgi:hypothetical protein